MELAPDMVDRFRVAPGTKVRLDRWNTRWDVPEGLEDLNKEELKQQAAEFVAERVREVADYQDLLWADGRRALLVVFQGLDGAGKDSTIKHVTSGMNPAGVRVISFKEPSRDELAHHYLWRYVTALPEQGVIGIYNRSYYEEVSVVRVFPELLKDRAMVDRPIDDTFWKERYEDITFLEKHLVRNGTVILKFFLHLSKDEQKKRLLQRLQDPHKQWKFAANDLVARDRWDDYQRVYESIITNTNSKEAPWWIMPADRKWAMRALVAQAISNSIRSLDLRYPPIDDAKHELIKQAIEKLKGG